MDVSLAGPGFVSAATVASACKQIGAGYDADELAVADHRHTFNLVALHEMDDLIERGIFGHRSHLRSHHIADLASGRLHVLGRKAPRTHQKFDPTRTLALGPRFGPA